jgi:hypothetical protein
MLMLGVQIRLVATRSDATEKTSAQLTKVVHSD